MADSTHYQGVQKASTGFKLLKSMGWSEGEGLGANKQGLKEHIRVRKKFEMWGVGAVESHNRTSNWSNGMSEFHRVLSSLSEITSKHAGGSGSEEDNRGDRGDEVEDRSVGREKQEGKGAEGKAKKKDKKKEMKKEKEKKRKRKDAAAKSAEEAAVVAVREKGEKKKATHIGRFKRRESSKMVKGYSSSDLAAILGEDPFAKQAAAMQTIKNTVDPAGSSSDDDAPGHDPVATDHPAAEASKINKAQVDSWWAGYFMVGPRAGSRGEKAAIKKKGKKSGFSEADQEALDAWAHSHATHGKVGLGRSSMKKTIGGAKWEGTKTKLGSDSDDDEAAVVIDEEEIGDDGGQEDSGIQIVLPQKRAVVDAGDADGALRRVRALLSKEKKKELKVKVLAKAVDISKEDLLKRLGAKPDFKLSRSKSRVRLAV